MRITVIAVGCLVTIIGLIAAIGAMLPQSHSVSRSIVVRGEPRAVYEVIRSFGAAPQWRKDVQRVEVMGPAQFREHGKQGTVTYDVVADEPGRRLVTRIADRDLGYSGAWTYSLEPVAEGTRVTITEDGEVTNVFFRFLSRFVFGHTSTIDGYLAALQRRLD